MRILVLTARFPIPPIGGDKLRIHEIARHLSGRGHELTLLSLCDPSDPWANAGESAQGIFRRVLMCPLPRARRRWSAAAGLLSPLPLQVSYFHSGEFRRMARREMEEGGHDAVVCHLLRTAEPARRMTGVRRVCEMTDAFSMYYEDVIRRRRWGFRSFLYRGVEFRRMRRYEIEILDAFDRSVVVSPVDRDYILSRRPDLSEKLSVIPNGVDCTKWRFYAGPYDDRLIVFIGNMRTSRNADACIHFAEEVLPLVRRHVPHVTFKIVGAHPRPDVRRLARNPGVVVTGQVDDVQSEAQRAGVSVCPMRLAAGVQNKVLESMAMGVPVVGSPAGVRGLAVTPGRDLLVGSGAPDFARKVAEVLLNPDRRRALAQSARAKVERDYSWERMAAAYEQVLRGEGT